MVKVFSAPSRNLTARVHISLLLVAAMSKRSVLLTYLTKQSDGGHVCTLCSDLTPQKFKAGSGATAWQYHLKHKHPAIWRDIDAQTRQTSASTVSVALSIADEAVSSPPPAKKQRREDPASSGSAASSIRDHFGASADPPTLLPLLARALIMGGVAYRFVESACFREFLTSMKWRGVLPSREAIKNSMVAQSVELRAQLVSLLQSRPEPVSIALDGWTNVQHNKVTNIVLLAGGRPYYWVSIVNEMESNTAEWMFEKLLPILVDVLINVHKLRVVAVAADNEAVNGALIRRLRRELPFLVHTPCAAHTIQLVVKNILDAAAFSTLVEQLHDVLRYFDAKEHRNALKQLQLLRNAKPLCLRKPNDTRWSSTLMAIERLLEMQKEVECCFDVPSIPNKREFFVQLKELREFLAPFRTATDIIQQDSATLLDVYQQFIVLWQHTRQKDARWAAVSLLQRWNQHVNISATSACALLSFATLPESLSQQKALDFIVEFGVAYLTYYEENVPDGLEGLLLLQLSDFIGRTGAFASLESKWQLIRSTKQHNVDARTVWRLFTSNALAHVAIALLSIPASEASVERTFSLQAAVHNKQRNRMLESTVENEMFLRFNQNVLAKENVDDSCAEMDDDFDAASHAEAFTLWEEADSELNQSAVPPVEEEHLMEEEQQEEKAEPAASASSAAAAPSSSRPRRTDSSVMERNKDFIDWWIDENGVTDEFQFTREIRNRLENDAWDRNRGGLSTKELEKQIRAEARRRALEGSMAD